MGKLILTLLAICILLQHKLVGVSSMPLLEEARQSGKIIIYLAGKIPKDGQSPQSALHWTQELMDQLRSNLPDYELLLLNPVFKDCDLTDQDTVFGRDMYYVSGSHVLFVDARVRRGLGVGAEMMWAKMNGIPIVTWAPEDTHYNRNASIVEGVEVPGFIHPFINSLSDQLVGSIEEGAAWIKGFLEHPHSCQVVDPKAIHSVVHTFKTNTQVEGE